MELSHGQNRVKSKNTALTIKKIFSQECPVEMALLLRFISPMLRQVLFPYS
jgi:hypothetical protein